MAKMKRRGSAKVSLGIREILNSDELVATYSETGNCELPVKTLSGQLPSGDT